MKKIKHLFLLPIIFIGALFLGTSSCALDDECQESTSVCGTFTACCNGAATECWYEYDGKTYDCNGTDCNDAATELAEDMCDDYYTSQEDFDAFKEQLLEAIECGCN